jgi:hypothetical protein
LEIGIAVHLRAARWTRRPEGEGDVVHRAGALRAQRDIEAASLAAGEGWMLIKGPGGAMPREAEFAPASLDRSAHGGGSAGGNWRPGEKPAMSAPSSMVTRKGSTFNQDGRHAGRDAAVAPHVRDPDTIGRAGERWQ